MLTAVPTPRPLRVLVADDSPLLRLAVRDQLEQAGLDVCLETCDAVGAVAGALAERPDVCLLDVSMPGDGLEAASEIGLCVPGTKVVLLTETPTDAGAEAALAVGASGYLGKDVDPRRLPLILCEIAAGEVAFPRSLMRTLVASYRGVPRAATG